ncbi:uncharacterized protein LOC141928191 isoform X3 [Strix aluco]|uniref:uncharacterized protein LOC141928191 isoform X3 n=1 Tax=Strix aluco TaxID=111821 RepID=UPI003DA4E3C2
MGAAAGVHLGAEKCQGEGGVCVPSCPQSPLTAQAGAWDSRSSLPGAQLSRCLHQPPRLSCFMEPPCSFSCWKEVARHAAGTKRPGGSKEMWLLWFQFSLHLATEKLDPWFGLWLGGGEERSLDPIPAREPLPAPQRQQ